MGFWRSRAFVDDDTAAWHFENFAWLMGEFGTNGLFDRTDLVLPKPGTFATSEAEGHDLALELFEKVKAMCEMEDFPILLVADDSRGPQPADAVYAPQRENYALGTFLADTDGVMITYAPSLLKRPQDLIATFAHELSHCLIATRQTALVCADEEEEFLTDLCAVFLGFGVFLANTRFSHTVSSVGLGQAVGWQRTGYLPERDIMFATAIFLSAKGIDPDVASPFLKSHLRGELQKACAYLDGHPAIADLKRIARETTPA